MPITKKNKILVETFCDLCGQSQGTSLIDPSEYADWLKHTVDLLTFTVNRADVSASGKYMTVGPEECLLCWECIKKHGLTKEYDRRLNELTYGPKDKK